MRKYIFGILALAICTMESCNRNTTTACSQGQQVSVTVPLCTSKQEIVLRTTDENIISDVNLYLVQEQEVLLHKYSFTPTVQFNFPPGNYRLYVIANHHADLGDLDFQSLFGYTLHTRDEYQDLPMTAVRDIVIEATTEEQVLPPLEVTRSVAKINYSVQLASHAHDITLQSLQIVSLPVTFRPFDHTHTSSSFCNEEIVEVLDSHISGSFYMLPNLQGTRSEITSPQHKNPQNAPEHATCLRIRATSQNKVMDYWVYLGENETSDFNIRPNTAHTILINILSDDEADIRITRYTVDVICDMAAKPENGVYLTTAPITLSAQLSGNTSEAGLFGELCVEAGNVNFFNVNGISAQNVPLTLKSGVNKFSIHYMPPDYFAENAILSFTLSIYDKYGFSKSYDFTYRFARNVVKIYTKWFDGGNNIGTLSSPDAVLWLRQTTPSAIYYLFYCDRQCTIVPEPIGRFKGFYRTHDLKDFISSDAKFLYRPVTTYDTLYTYFY